MSSLKLTKNELRAQQIKLTQLQKYLPTLQLKKALLQSEVQQVRAEINKLQDIYHTKRLEVSAASGLLTLSSGIQFEQAARVSEIKKTYENIAGVDIPLFNSVVFTKYEYPLFSTPTWADGMIHLLRKMVEAKCQIQVAQEKKGALEKELRDVSIRVNLFEKKLIPQSLENIKRIKVFLGDQELAAVGQAKVAKSKLEKRKESKK